MRYWTERDFEGASQLPTAVAYIADGLADALDLRGGMPRLISIGYSEDLEDAYRYKIVIEIVPGVRLPVELGSTEDDQSAIDPETEGDDVILDVLEAFDICLPRIERLSDLLHDARVRIRSVNRRPKRTPYRRAKGTPFVEQRDGYDGRTVRAGCGVGRA